MDGLLAFWDSRLLCEQPRSALTHNTAISHQRFSTLPTRSTHMEPNGSAGQAAAVWAWRTGHATSSTRQQPSRQATGKQAGSSRRCTHPAAQGPGPSRPPCGGGCAALAAPGRRRLLPLPLAHLLKSPQGAPGPLQTGRQKPFGRWQQQDREWGEDMCGSIASGAISLRLSCLLTTQAGSPSTITSARVARRRPRLEASTWISSSSSSSKICQNRQCAE